MPDGRGPVRSVDNRCDHSAVREPTNPRDAGRYAFVAKLTRRGARTITFTISRSPIERTTASDARASASRSSAAIFGETSSRSRTLPSTCTIGGDRLLDQQRRVGLAPRRERDRRLVAERRPHVFGRVRREQVERQRGDLGRLAHGGVAGAGARCRSPCGWRSPAPSAGRRRTLNLNASISPGASARKRCVIAAQRRRRRSSSPRPGCS